MTANTAPAGATAIDARPRGAGVVRIERARFDELPALARLQRRGFGVDRGYGLLTLLTLWFTPRTLMLVVRADGDIAGMVIGDTRPGITPHGRILNLCVAPEFRRHGLGRDLMHTAEALLPAERVVLMVDQKNAPAVALYTSLGYLGVGLEPDYYGRHRHALVMQKTRAAR